jgi:beta-galactosidase
MANAEGYKGTQKKAFHGMCLAIVQANAKAGQIRVTANSPGLKSGSVTVTTKM